MFSYFLLSEIPRKCNWVIGFLIISKSIYKSILLSDQNVLQNFWVFDLAYLTNSCLLLFSSNSKYFDILNRVIIIKSHLTRIHPFVNVYILLALFVQIPTLWTLYYSAWSEKVVKVITFRSILLTQPWGRHLRDPREF